MAGEDDEEGGVAVDPVNRDGAIAIRPRQAMSEHSQKNRTGASEGASVSERISSTRSPMRRLRASMICSFSTSRRSEGEASPELTTTTVAVGRSWPGSSHTPRSRTARSRGRGGLAAAPTG